MEAPSRITGTTLEAFQNGVEERKESPIEAAERLNIDWESVVDTVKGWQPNNPYAPSDVLTGIVIGLDCA